MRREHNPLQDRNAHGHSQKHICYVSGIKTLANLQTAHV